MARGDLTSSGSRSCGRAAAFPPASLGTARLVGGPIGCEPPHGRILGHVQLAGERGHDDLEVPRKPHRVAGLRLDSSTSEPADYRAEHPEIGTLVTNDDLIVLLLNGGDDGVGERRRLQDGTDTDSERVAVVHRTEPPTSTRIRSPSRRTG